MTSDTTQNTATSFDPKPKAPDVEVPDITIIVFASLDKLEYLVLQKDYPQPEDAGRIIATDIPEPVSFWEDLGSVLAGSVRLGNPSKDRLKSIWYQLESLGEELYNKLLTDQLRRLAAQWPSGHVIQIVTNEKWIPWELIFDGADFWGNKFIIARVPKITRGVALFSRNVSTLMHSGGLSKIANIIGGGLGGNSTSERIRKLFHRVDDDIVIVQEKSTLIEVVHSLEQADIIHFTCHGHLEPMPCFQLAEATPEHPSFISSRLTVLEVKRLKNIEGSLVFANTCTSLGISVFLGELRNWGWEFYSKGADAYIGTLSLVPVQYALEFAEKFYSKFLVGYNVGESLRHAKFHTKRDNPFWLLYSLYGNPFMKKSVD